MASFLEKMTGLKKCPQCGQQEISLDENLCRECKGFGDTRVNIFKEIQKPKEYDFVHSAPRTTETYRLFKTVSNSIPKQDAIQYCLSFLRNHKFAVVILISLIWVIFLYAANNKIKDENLILLTSLSDYQDALREANNNIVKANSMADRARSLAGSTYNDMIYALESLEIVDTVPEP